jgi:transcriptional regulator with XRE-family HTH domain
MEARRIVGWNVRRLRVAKQLTIEDLADEARTDTSFLARLERGQVNVGLDILERIGHALKAELTDLVVKPAPGDKPPQPLKAGRRPTRSTSKK